MTVPDSRTKKTAAVEAREEQLVPTSQEVADVLSRSYDATMDLISLLNYESVSSGPNGLERLALERIGEHLYSRARGLANELSRDLRFLPEPSEARRHDFVASCSDDDIPF